MTPITDTDDFPLIYCNGDSYSDPIRKDQTQTMVYADFVAQHCSGFVLNKALSGSCNRRIVRTTVHDMIQQRQLNPNQKIVALIGLSFEIRSELWIDQASLHLPEESQFKPHTFSRQIEWRQNLLDGKDIQPENTHLLAEKFFQKFSEGRAYFYSPWAERINLLCDLVMLRSLLESLNVEFLIFQGPPADALESDYLLDFFKQQINDDPRFFDIETFGFCEWCYKENFVPLDFHDRPTIAHYGPDAHQAFAEKVLLPKLKELDIL
jgi:hypothetical protein